MSMAGNIYFTPLLKLYNDGKKSLQHISSYWNTEATANIGHFPFAETISENSHKFSYIWHHLSVTTPWIVIIPFSHIICSDCMVQALLLNEEDRGFCGGTILNEYIILTAAHCMNQTRYMYIKLGDSTVTQQRIDQHFGQVIFCDRDCFTRPYVSRGVWCADGWREWSCLWSGGDYRTPPIPVRNLQQRHCAHETHQAD